MLSYRHGFHAGNHADVLKHTVLVECIRTLCGKDAPLQYIDTHAGAGSYALSEGYAAMNEEWAGGVERLRAFAESAAPPQALASYLEVIRAYRVAHGEAYPGSPAIAAAELRSQDRLALFELHPSDSGPLSSLFEEDRRVRVSNADGFACLRGLLPPPSRRGLVLVDPSYELAADYDRVVATLEMAIRRFATGVYVVWYPLLEREEARALPSRLEGLADRTLDARLRVRTSRPGERGMAGSGMMIVNPPWRLKEALEPALPYLARALALDAGSGSSLTARGLD
ncbi:MAG: 23S rRNA (adenine(2030)-N(6))-methyltransferase RlmJ [Spirochaetae bacterium HGW-Spirochaetae-3]|jgi:23S rRNA (adenine2030-N6)-methyltransferase|nr:MAG: 23S rRNA (adenine(2030)-N(6))-methyltransferase RlmJ [Spirochaetae bacterium HGW-Spirochaetae-3]